MPEDLPPFHFDRDLGMWMEDIASPRGLGSETLTLATFNVWFWHRYFYERFERLLEILRSSEADLIALQEVTPEFLQVLLERDWIREHYWISDSLGDSVSPYGVLLLMRFPPGRLALHALPSVMGRRLLVAEFELNEESMQVATVHLESTRPRAQSRAEQLEQIQPILRRSEHSVLLGDLNFCSSWVEERENLDPDFHDLWPLLRGEEPGYTVDTERNVMRREEMQETKRVRFDRVIWRSSGSGWIPRSIELLGTEPVPHSRPPIFASDHFGLLARLDRESEWPPGEENT